MIEKILTNVKWHQLKKVIPDDQNVIDQIMTKKINELVDVVNEMASYVGRLGVDFIEPKTPSDIYAEQRKWVGKLCKFWFADAEHPTFGILDFVDAGLHPEPFHIDCGESEQGWYPHCEPVKADSDIIYKGGNNE